MDSKPNPQRKVRCPQCGALTLYDVSNPWRPFCSQRCKTIDLGAWASEAYRLPAQPQTEDVEVATPPDAAQTPQRKPH
jgi:endogenous inhibitor of DNA gyrase (YacG/DUF329 family)